MACHRRDRLLRTSQTQLACSVDVRCDAHPMLCAIFCAAGAKHRLTSPVQEKKKATNKASEKVNVRLIILFCLAFIKKA